MVISDLKKLQMSGIATPAFSIIDSQLLNILFDEIKNSISEELKKIESSSILDGSLPLDELLNSIRKKILEVKFSPTLLKILLEKINEGKNWNFLKDYFAIKIITKECPPEKENLQENKMKSDFILFVKGESFLITSIKSVIASTYCQENISYLGKDQLDYKIMIQEMIVPDVSGFISTANEDPRIPDAFNIKSSWGSGEIFYLKEHLDYDHWIVDNQGGFIFSKTGNKQYSFNLHPQNLNEAVLMEVDSDKMNIPSLKKNEFKKIIDLAIKCEKILGGAPLLIDFVLAKKVFYVIGVKRILTFSDVNRNFPKMVYDHGLFQNIFKKEITHLTLDYLKIFSKGFFSFFNNDFKSPFSVFNGKVYFELGQIKENFYSISFPLFKLIITHCFKISFSELDIVSFYEQDLSKEKRKFSRKSLQWMCLLRGVVSLLGNFKVAKNGLFTNKTKIRMDKKQHLLIREKILDKMEKRETYILSLGKKWGALAYVTQFYNLIFQEEKQFFIRRDIEKKECQTLLNFIHGDESLTKLFREKNVDAIYHSLFVEGSDRQTNDATMADNIFIQLKYLLIELTDILQESLFYDFNLDRNLKEDEIKKLVLFLKKEVSLENDKVIGSLPEEKSSGGTSAKKGMKTRLKTMLEKSIHYFSNSFIEEIYDEYVSLKNDIIEVEKFLIANNKISEEGDLVFLTLDEIKAILSQSSLDLENNVEKIKIRKVEFQKRQREIKKEKFYSYGEFFLENKKLDNRPFCEQQDSLLNNQQLF